MKRLILSAFFLMICSLDAHADKAYAIETLNFDEMVGTTTRAFATYLKNMRETNTWKRWPDRLVVDVTSISECRDAKFTMMAEHEKIAGGVSDSLVFIRCGKPISRMILERTGAGVTALDDDKLYEFDLPPPSASETYRFRWTLYKMHFTSRPTTVANTKGTVSSFDFTLSGMPFTTRIEEAEKTVGPETVRGRRYTFDIYQGGMHSMVTFDQRRIQEKGLLPSYRYRIESERSTVEYTAASYREKYSTNIEANTVGNLVMMMQFLTEGFPYVQAN